MTTTLTMAPIGQISRSVKNIQQSIDWYKNKLGLAHLYTYGKLSFFDCGGTRLFLEETDEPSAESVLRRHRAELASWAFALRRDALGWRRIYASHCKKLRQMSRQSGGYG